MANKKNQIANKESFLLEEVLETKVKPIISGMNKELFGIELAELSDDISSKIKNSNLLRVEPDISLSYRDAKNAFKKRYLTKLLLIKLGNITEAAKAAGIDRRTMHRLVKKHKIDVKAIKKSLEKPYYIKLGALSDIIESVITSYENILHPDKISMIYKNLEKISRSILDELPELELSLKDAELLFERDYFKRLIAITKTISEASAKAGIRQETLSRKLKALGISKRRKHI